MAEPLLNPEEAAAGVTRLLPPELSECPEPGCTEQLRLDLESPNVMRCEMHGPMIETLKFFDRVGAELRDPRIVSPW